MLEVPTEQISQMAVGTKLPAHKIYGKFSSESVTELCLCVLACR